MDLELEFHENKTKKPKTSSSFRKKSPQHWNSDDVYCWLLSIGFNQYADFIAYEHKIDGVALLMLSEKDLREKPMEMQCVGDIKRLSLAISNIRNRYQSVFHEYSFDNPVWDDDIGNLQICGFNKSDERDEMIGHKLLSKEEIIRKVESPDTEKKSLFKLGIALSYCALSLLIAAFVMVYVHDRVPDMDHYPPLPDLLLDSIPKISWGFQVCEIIAIILFALWFMILFFHKHRVVIMRRMFSLVGTVFLLRSVTMVITSLSVPGDHVECRRHTANNTINGSASDNDIASVQCNRTLASQLLRAYHIWSGLGMSIQGVRTCGDYMFSGHTTTVTLLNHFITEYTPDNWYGLHTATWVLNLFAIFFILAAHEHYSIDVFIAFYISSRMFLYYHAYAYHHYNVTKKDGRMRIWFPLGWFFEAGSYGRVDNEFEVPSSLFLLPQLLSRPKHSKTSPSAEKNQETQNHLTNLRKRRKKN